MSVANAVVAELAARLSKAVADRTAIEQLTVEHPEFDLATAYRSSGHRGHDVGGRRCSRRGRFYGRRARSRRACRIRLAHRARAAAADGRARHLPRSGRGEALGTELSSVRGTRDLPLCVAPSADRLGRRPVTLACMVVITVGMLLSAASQSAGQLGAFRVLTGIGIGGILATSIVIAAEYSSRRWRGLAVSLNSAGYAIGATVGGLLAVLLIDQFGWRTVFLVGGVLSAAALPLTWWAGPRRAAHHRCRHHRDVLIGGSAGINRHGGGDGRALRRRGSDPRRPRVMRRRPARAWRSVDRGTCRPGY